MLSGPFPEVFFMIFGMKNGGKIMTNPDGIRSGTKTAIFRGRCYFVGPCTKSDVRTCRKSVRNPEKTVTGRRRRPRRVPGVILHDFGAKTAPKSLPKGGKMRSKFEAKKSMPKRPEKVARDTPAHRVRRSCGGRRGGKER